MAVDDPVVITCAISGAVANRDQCPAIPYTPEEYAAEARRAVDAGASMIHIHARTRAGTPSYEVEDFRAITEAIKGDVDVVVNHSTGAIGVPVDKRVAYLRELAPDVAALNMGSMNYAKYSRSRRDFVFAMVFANPFAEIVELLEAMNELGIKPEHECFDLGHVGSLDPLMHKGVLRPPLLADYGADVLKVEDTGLGDYIRWAPPRYDGVEPSAASALFLSLNRGKRSVRLDLKVREGRDVLLRLVRQQDVVLESF